MENMTSREKKAIKTKKKLFNCAISLFKKKGYKNVSINEIVEKANTSKGTFYHHFNTKDEIIIEEMKKYEQHYTNIYNNIEKQKTEYEKLIAFTKEVFKFTEEYIGVDVIKVIYSTQLYNEVDNIYVIDEKRNLYTMVNKIINAGQKKGEFIKNISHKKITRMAIRCMRGTLYEWGLYDGKYNLIENGMFYFSLFVNGIINKSNIDNVDINIKK